MTGTVTVDVPARFYDDHKARELPSGEVVKVLASKYRVRLDPDEYSELLSDAEHYAGDAMMDWWEDGRGVILSARATVRALKAAAR